METTSNSIHEFMAQDNIAIISDSRDPRSFCHTVKDKLQQCGHTIKHIKPCLDDFDEDGKCLCVTKLPAVFSALIIDLQPAAASIIMDEAILKGITHIWLLPRSYNCILREKGTDNKLNLIYNKNILNYLEIPNSFYRIFENIKKYAVQAIF